MPKERVGSCLHQRDTVFGQQRVLSDQDHTIEEALGDEQTVERVFVQQRECPGFTCSCGRSVSFPDALSMNSLSA